MNSSRNRVDPSIVLLVDGFESVLHSRLLDASHGSLPTSSLARAFDAAAVPDIACSDSLNASPAFVLPNETSISADGRTNRDAFEYLNTCLFVIQPLFG